MEIKYLAIMIVLALIFLIIGGALQTGTFQKIKDSFKVNASFGMEELPGGEAVLREDIANSVSSLHTKIQQMLDSSQVDCFDKFDGFNQQMGEGDKTAKVKMVYDETMKGTKFQVTNRLDQTPLMFEISGMKPCVIAGEGTTRQFYEHFIKGTLSADQLETNTYVNPVQQIEIFYNEEGINDNVIRAWDVQGQFLSESDNFESNGYLFKGKFGEICFFPTNYNKNDDADGIANEWFGIKEKNSIPNRLARGELAHCSERTAASEVIVDLGEEGSFYFRYDRSIPIWKYKLGEYGSWKLVTDYEIPPGGTPYHQIIIEELRNLNEEEGHALLKNKEEEFRESITPEETGEEVQG